MSAIGMGLTNGTAGVSAGNGTTASRRDSELGREQFLQLLLIQLQNQDPLNPIKDSDFTAQLAQLSSLDNFEKLNANFAEMLVLQELNQGANLIGKQIVFQRPGSSELSRGVVESVNVNDSKVQLVVGANNVEISQVRGIEPPPIGK